MSPTASIFILAVQLALIFGGGVLLWRLVFSRRARAQPPALGPWDITGTDFLFFLWHVICGGFVGPFLMGLWLKTQHYDGDVRAIFTTAAFQGGMFLGIVVYHLGFGRRRTPIATTAPAAGNPVLSGIATYFITLPVVLVVSLFWMGLLKALDIPTPQQEAIDILGNTGHRLALGLLLLCALVIAPVTEELIFRAGIFRFMRTRTPRWVALLLPACLFGAMHANLASFAPLVALGVVFSLAYERTGRIGTSIIAHALFNLTTTALVLAGLDV